MRNITREIVAESPKFKLACLATELAGVYPRGMGCSDDHILLTLFKNGVASAFGSREALIKLRAILKIRVAELNRQQKALRDRGKFFARQEVTTRVQHRLIRRERARIVKNRGRLAELVAITKSLDFIIKQSSLPDFTSSEPEAARWAENNLVAPSVTTRRRTREVIHMVTKGTISKEVSA